MGTEIIEAIMNYYKADEETAIDCLVYLNKTTDSISFAMEIEKLLTSMDRCELCGSKLEFKYWDEYHPEVQAFEHMCEAYCPECDK